MRATTAAAERANLVAALIHVKSVAKPFHYAEISQYLLRMHALVAVSAPSTKDLNDPHFSGAVHMESSALLDDSLVQAVPVEHLETLSKSVASSSYTGVHFGSSVS